MTVSRGGRPKGTTRTTWTVKLPEVACHPDHKRRVLAICTGLKLTWPQAIRALAEGDLELIEKNDPI